MSAGVGMGFSSAGFGDVPDHRFQRIASWLLPGPILRSGSRAQLLKFGVFWLLACASKSEARDARKSPSVRKRAFQKMAQSAQNVREFCMIDNPKDIHCLELAKILE